MGPVGYSRCQAGNDIADVRCRKCQKERGEGDEALANDTYGHKIGTFKTRDTVEYDYTAAGNQVNGGPQANGT
ncbi:hypothetical protein DL765_001972 [Monosporascus sp. GIB2]|nr:hypothetical protein DL765_001972 [Monosporascus sp. GIB2]